MKSRAQNILITGGAGYIGSHMVRLLLEQGFKPVVFDNLSTGHKEFIPKGVPLVKGDLRDPAAVRRAFRRYPVSAVVHFAAAIVVPESVAEPLNYYENNVSATVNLLKGMKEAGVRRIVFSSSACVYGNPLKSPILENEPLKIENPYGATKVMVEQILGDLARAGCIDFIALRYFNVAGAHSQGGIGIKMAKPTHLIPNVMRVACGLKKELAVFGDDYPTKDGTCVRDYVHVVDLVEAHLLALRALAKGKVKNEVINLGNGRGFSVKEVIEAAVKVTGRPVPHKVLPRRPGDSVNVVASYAKARRLLGWKPQRGLDTILSSAYQWECAGS
ncbi:MAG: UDP-glucose 4-epimerase GalE [Candidatus Omnitrophica bacterium]|nr:UDP-glucose 4-epimerase GalE [Candidatus Omnitrophota bacterium]